MTIKSTAGFRSFGRLGVITLLVLALACSGDGGTGPSEPAIGPIGPFPPDLLGKVAFGTRAVITTSSGAYIETKVHVVDIAHPEDRVIFTARDIYLEGLTWSPDGEHLVLQTHQPQNPGSNGENRDVIQLHSVDLAGTEDHVVFDGSGPKFHPEYSADGRLAYFAGVSNDPSSGIFINGQPVHPLLYDANSWMSWRPDGVALAYTWESTGLSELALGGGSVTQLIAPEGGEVIGEPAYSPDGASIAIMRFSGARQGEELWIVTATGADPQRLTAGFSDDSPAWTPGGKYIAFSRLANSNPGIYLIAPHGSAAIRVIGGEVGLVAWSR
jgi:Tol biopolymer transport system component